ncbi:peroxidasin homolog [Hydractinia symbiolongicarpus]|uniref:peroxidasin homolog n=1 Tax=Hydractinia symbiolongicarpus TaxID=13093 RepID=UPI00254CC744|nr:peroxidasin homolog [Hydractinia symbiolongicarpus]
MKSMLFISAVLSLCWQCLCQGSFNPGDTLSNCVPAVQTSYCNPYRYYKGFRSIDGTCNNYYRPTQGAAFTGLTRLLPGDYVDGVDTPRGFPGTSPVVPTANQVAGAVFSLQNQNVQRTRGLSAMFMAFGQFLDHDFGLTEHPSCDVSAGVGVNIHIFFRCGSVTAFTYPCFPIRFQRNGQTCTSFARSFPVCQSRFGQRSTREQINEVSSYIDLSQVYSSELEVHKSLRRLDGKRLLRVYQFFLRNLGSGLMKVDQSDLLPIRLPASDPECNNPAGCSLVGDPARGDENIALNTIHVVFVRNHNHIVKKLQGVSRAASEEFLFETARKINIAIFQNIVYNEFLPNIVDLKTYRGYDPSVDASILNVFSTAAFRFGHTLVPTAWPQLNSNFDKAFNDVSLQASFFNTVPIRQRGIEPTVFGLLANQSQAVDTTFAFGIARRLFVPVGENRHNDLTALNIQRARDHGIPTYGAWRQICNLKPVFSFSDLRGEMSDEVISRLQTVYSNPNDIDIFAAGMAENLANGKMLGPTFQCIQKIQFERLRDGDNYYFEKPGMFTYAQKEQIKKVKMARVLCDTLNGIVSVQEDVFQAARSSTIRKECGSIPDIEYSAWFNYYQGHFY